MDDPNLHTLTSTKDSTIKMIATPDDCSVIKFQNHVTTIKLTHSNYII